MPASIFRAAQKLLALDGRYSEIAVAATAGTSSALLASRIAGVLGPHYQVLTADQTGEPGRFRGLQGVLIALFGARRARRDRAVRSGLSRGEHLLHRRGTTHAGSSGCFDVWARPRAQLMGSVLAEAFVVGLIAAVLGVVLGIVGAVVLLAALPGAGLDLPSVNPSIRLVAVIVPLALGTGATLAACVLPALRATSVPPVAALRDDPVGETRRSAQPRGRPSVRSRSLWGSGSCSPACSPTSAHEGDFVGAGAVLAFVGLASLSPLAAKPLSRTLGWPLVARWGCLPGWHARTPCATPAHSVHGRCAARRRGARELHGGDHVIRARRPRPTSQVLSMPVT